MKQYDSHPTPQAQARAKLAAQLRSKVPQNDEGEGAVVRSPLLNKVAGELDKG